MVRKEKAQSLIGSWAFLIGVILAVLLGFIPMDQYPWTAYVLVIVGVIVGLLNISGKEAMGFLHAAAVLVIVTALSGNVFSSVNLGWAASILDALLLVFVPATIIVALRAVFSLAHD